MTPKNKQEKKKSEKQNTEKERKRPRNSPDQKVQNKATKTDKGREQTERENKMAQTEKPLEKSQFEALMQRMNEIHIDLSSSILKVDQRVSDLAQDVQKLKDDHKTAIKSISKVSKEMKTLHETVHVLQIANNKLEQKSLACDVLISGLPIMKKDQIPAVLNSLATHIGIEIFAADISDAYSIPTKNKNRSITIIKFHNQRPKTNLIAAFKAKKPIMIEDIVKLNSDDPRRGKEVFISSSLTPYNRNLKTAARNESSFQFAWERDGRILVRESANSRIIEINSIEQLNELVQTIRYSRNQNMEASNNDDDDDDDKEEN